MIEAKARENLQQILRVEAIQKGIRFIQEDEERFIDDIVTITKIESPTFREEKRAAYMRQRFEEAGLENTHIDAYGNVMGLLRGTNPDGTIVIDAHMDTVFPVGTVKTVLREGDYLKAPGVSDNTRGLATQIAMLRAFDACGVRPAQNLLFLGTTREEGLGMLGGMRDFLKENKEQIGALISIDGEKLPHIIYRATGMTTAKMVFRGVEGHAAINTANALHACARAIAKIADFELPTDVWSSFNVTVCQAGSDTEVHVVPAQAFFKYNVRSNSAQVLENLNMRILDACNEAIKEENERWGTDVLTLEREILAEAPANCSQPPEAMIVEAASEVIRWLGYSPVLENAGCTNASWGIAHGIPAICIGMNAVTEEMNFHGYMHNLNEQTYIGNAYKSVQYPWLLAWMCAGLEGQIPSVLKR